MSQSSRAPAPSAPAPPSNAAPVPPREGATAPSPFPFGMRNAATYASSSSTNFAEYEDLPGHHFLSIRNLIASSPNDSYPETASSIADDISFFMDNFTAEEAEDYSGVRDPGAFRSFQLAMAYCLTCSESQVLADFVAEWTDTQLPPPQIQALRRVGDENWRRCRPPLHLTPRRSHAIRNTLALPCV